ncbi:hypothetical protein QJS66_02310 [Kocuria rhizophila]|nr:hypothetical protein QJS66_02310 [Kocuria rhizophila]
MTWVRWASRVVVVSATRSTWLLARRPPSRRVCRLLGAGGGGRVGAAGVLGLLLVGGAGGFLRFGAQCDEERVGAGPVHGHVRTGLVAVAAARVAAEWRWRPRISPRRLSLTLVSEDTSLLMSRTRLRTVSSWPAACRLSCASADRPPASFPR